MRIIIYILFQCAVPVVGFGQTPQSIASVDSCILMRQTADSKRQGGQYQEAHDLYMQYVETCTGTVKTQGAFSSMNVTNFMRTKDPIRYELHREWLKKVLYYSLDSSYYCQDVFSMLNTFTYWEGHNGDYSNGAIAVAKYLIDSGKCSSLRDLLIQQVREERAHQLKVWRDTVQDSIATPIDTTLPSLEELDLTILRGPQNSVMPATLEPRLGELVATRNPFTDILELKYRLDKSAMVRIDVYDLLGRAVYSEGQGYKTEGEHVISLQSKGWASGSYYVRLSSPSGEVKTVKVVKE